LRFQSSQNPAGDLNPGTLQEAVAFVDARVAFYPENSRWELAFIGRNLTDQQRAIIVNGQTFTRTPAGTATSTQMHLSRLAVVLCQARLDDLAQSISRHGLNDHPARRNLIFRYFARAALLQPFDQVLAVHSR
jgi:hypothetical protein